jgi:hypothetical protein
MSAADVFSRVKGVEDVFTRYAVTVHIRGVMVGGVPSDPSVTRSWLKARLELEDPALEELLNETVAARDTSLSVAEKLDALLASDAAPSVNGFKRISPSGELGYEGRCMKAALKEFMNSAYPGTKFPGKPADIKKGLMRYAAECVFVEEDLIGLGVAAPTRVEERIKHVMTPQGPRSSISRVEVVEQPKLSFTLKVRDDFLPVAAWARVWSAGEEIGIGSDSARSDGRFALESFDRI